MTRSVRRHTTLGFAIGIAVGAALLGGCTSVPSPVPPVASAPTALPPVRKAQPAAPSLAARSLESRAREAQSSKRWADAALAWEALALIQPNDIQARERLLAVQNHIAQRVDALQREGDTALRRADLDRAMHSFLELLALDPTNNAAAQALRKLELERSRRTHVGRFAPSALDPSREPTPARTSGSERGQAAKDMR